MMPLREGYGWDAVHANLEELLKSGLSVPQATAAAFARGRVSFFKRYPQGALPTWLAYPHQYRMREHYTKNGVPLKKVSPKEYAENPQPNPRKLAQAARLYEDFTGKKATRITAHELPELPREGLAFGKLVQVGYESARDGRLYRHTFRERSRPLLVATPDGKTVLIVGGRYAFTDAGIEDR